MNALQVRPDAPAVDLAVHWKPGWREFGSSVVSFFTGPRPEKDSLMPPRRPMRVERIRAPIPWRSMLASVVWHVAVIWILILPIWGFLPAATPTLAPVQIELTWYGETKDLPPISLPAAAAKARPAARKVATPKTEDAPAADAFHPRQTILSLPVHITHPRQTLIQPAAPVEPPKIVTPLPNIVQWPAESPAKPKLQYSTSVSAPVVQKRTVTDVAAPDVANPEKNAGPINIASPAAPKLAPQLPINAMSARAAERKATHADAAPAPEVPSPGEGDPNLPRIIALSAAPAPPAPSVSVPRGNLAARISVSPEERKAGTSGGAPNGSAGGSGAGANASSANASTGEGSSGSSLPATIMISPGRAPVGSGGGGASAGDGLGGDPLGHGLKGDPAVRHAPGIAARTMPCGPREQRACRHAPRAYDRAQ